MAASTGQASPSTEDEGVGSPVPRGHRIPTTGKKCLLAESEVVVAKGTAWTPGSWLWAQLLLPHVPF